MIRYTSNLHVESIISQEEFVKKYINSGIVIKEKGRWGTYHWRINPKKDIREKGNYQNVNIISGDTKEEVLKKYYNKYFKK